jgi:hypothetical protein
MEKKSNWQELHPAHHPTGKFQHGERIHPHVPPLDRHVDAMLDLGKQKKWKQVEQEANELKHQCLTRGYYAIAALAEKVRWTTSTKKPEKNWKAPMLDIIWRLARAERLKKLSPLVGMSSSETPASEKRTSNEAKTTQSNVTTRANTKTKQVFTKKAPITKSALLAEGSASPNAAPESSHETIPAPHAETTRRRSGKRSRGRRSSRR